MSVKNKILYTVTAAAAVMFLVCSVIIAGVAEASGVISVRVLPFYLASVGWITLFATVNYKKI